MAQLLSDIYKTKKAAICEVAAFLADGYSIIGSTPFCVFLRHRGNGNKVRIALDGDSFSITKNGKLIKKSK